MPAAASASPSVTGSTGTHRISVACARSHGSRFHPAIQIVERYLGGRLPVKGAQDFEHFCESTRNCSMRSVSPSASMLRCGCWRPVAGRPLGGVPAALVGAIAGAAGTVRLLRRALGIRPGGSTNKLATQTHKSPSLQQQLAAQALDPAQSTRRITVIEPDAPRAQSGPHRRRRGRIGESTSICPGRHSPASTDDRSRRSGPRRRPAQPATIPTAICTWR